MSYTDSVDPMSVRTTAADLVGDQPSASGNTFYDHQIAKLHRYVNEIETERYVRRTAPFNKRVTVGTGTMRIGDGWHGNNVGDHYP